MVSLHRGRLVVVHRCSSFPIDPKNFSRGVNFYQKLPFLEPRPHFKATMVKFGMRVRSWAPSPRQNFVKMTFEAYVTPARPVLKSPYLT